MPEGQGNGPAELTMLYAGDLGVVSRLNLPRTAAVLDAPSQAIRRVLATADAVDPQELGRMRGGFALPDGVSLAFGFDLATSVNGELLQRVNLPLTQITTGFGVSVPLSVTVGSDSYSLGLPMGAGSAPISIVSLTNEGLTSVTTVLGGGGVFSMLQNQANNQVLQQTRVFDVSITGMSQLLAEQARQTLVGNALAAGALLKH
jgi:hypothetical protein